MNKKLHKSLYSKKDKRPNYPTVNKDIESNIDITDLINLWLTFNLTSLSDISIELGLDPSMFKS